MIYSNLDFNHKTILITGGAGFIGSNLAFYLQNNFPKAKIIIFDCFRSNEFLENGNLISYGHYKNLIGFYGEVICGNVNNKIDLSMLDNFNFDYIFHHAAISDTRAYNQELVLRTNVNSFYSILEIAKKHDSVLVYASLAATYGNLPAPQVEGDENPENPYGYSKLLMDQIASQYSKENSNMTIVGLRFFNVYGPREFYKAKTASMVIQLAHQLLNGKAPRLFINSHKIYRDFIFIDDVIQANIKACQPSEEVIFNIGSGTSRSFQDVVNILKMELNIKIETEYFPNPFSGYQNHTQADINSSKKVLNFNPKFSLEKGIKTYLPDIIKLYPNIND